jgi:hypothetical protein
MNKSSLKILAAIALALVLILFAMQLDNNDLATDGGLLLPELKSEINQVSSVTVTRSGDDGETIISKQDDSWVIASRENYPADVGKLRELLLALADAKIVESKTSNPELYGQLGLRDPEIEGSKGTRIELHGTSREYELIVGNVAQAGFRYVRIAGEPQSWLVDQNPDIPGSAGEWLLRNIIDIKVVEIRSATISHPDGEEIRIIKESAEASDFEVANIPEGRELSYATVTNSITGVLSALTLDDVRTATEMSAQAVTTTFETFDGSRVTVRTEKSDDESWISLHATAIEEDVETIADINARVEGWHFRIPEYKANQLTRRWEDILKAETE